MTTELERFRRECREAYESGLEPLDWPVTAEQREALELEVLGGDEQLTERRIKFQWVVGKLVNPITGRVIPVVDV